MFGTAMAEKRSAASIALLLVLLLATGIFSASTFAAKKPPAIDGQKEFQAGQKAEAQKDYDTALRHYDEAVKQNPTEPAFLMADYRMRFQAGAAHIEKGHKYLGQGDLKAALAEFEQAAAIDPSNDVGRQEVVRTRALIQQRSGLAAPPQAQPAPPVTGQAPAEPNPQPSPNYSPRLDDALGPAELKPLSRAPINLHLTNEAKVIFETIGKLAGVNVLFDPDFVSKRIPVELNNVSLEEALDQTALLTKTFWKVLTSNTILVIPDTAVKRREQEEQIIRTFYLSNPITPQELTEAVTAIRSLLETRRIQQINSLNAIIIRDTPDRVAIAEKIIQDIDKAKPEVVVDVAVLEVSRNFTNQYGLYPTSNGQTGINIPLTFTGGANAITNNNTTSTSTTGTTTTTTPITTTPTTTTPTPGSIALNQVGHLNTSEFAVTLPGATLQAMLADSKTRVLQRPQVRASDGQKATLRIGERVPVASGSFQAGVGGVGVNPLVNTQFQYIDVGVNMDITPKVHGNDEVSLKLRIEVSQVSGENNIGGIQQPVIGQRIIDHDIRLREGEINVLGGLLQTQTTKSISGIPGLSQIPFLKKIFSNVSDTIAEDEVLIVMTPHTIRQPAILPLNRKALDVGTEGDVRLRSSSSGPETVPALPAGAPSPAVPAAPPAVGIGAQATPGTAPKASPRIHLENASLVQKTGDTFDVPVRVESAGDLSSASFEVSYNAGLMKLVTVRSGGFLGKDGQPVAVVERTDEQSGNTVVTLNRPPATAGVTGEGTLAVLTFQAAQPGTTPIGVSPSGARAEPLLAERSQATVTIH